MFLGFVLGKGVVRRLLKLLKRTARFSGGLVSQQ